MTTYYGTPSNDDSLFVNNLVARFKQFLTINYEAIQDANTINPYIVVDDSKRYLNKMNLSGFRHNISNYDFVCDQLRGHCQTNNINNRDMQAALKVIQNITNNKLFEYAQQLKQTNLANVYGKEIDELKSLCESNFNRGMTSARKISNIKSSFGKLKRLIKEGDMNKVNEQIKLMEDKYGL